MAEPLLLRAVQLTGPSGGGSTFQLGGAGSWSYLKRIIIGTSAASAVVTVYHGQDATGTIVATIDASTITRQDTDFSCQFKNGFFITVTGGAAKVTVIFG